MSNYFDKFKSIFSDNYQIQNDFSTTSRSSFSTNYNFPTRPTSISGTVKRKQQLKPTHKLNINRKIPELQTKSFSSSENDSKYKSSSLDYDSVRPIFGFSKYIALCGLERGNGYRGCECFNQPCQWSGEWTKHYNPKNKKLYKNLCYERCDMKNVEQIEKDLPRTYPDCPTFLMNNQFRDKLRNILRIYSIYDIQTGYVQGMNMIAAVLLYHIKKEQETFWAFVDIMDQQELRMIYQLGFKALKDHAARIVSIIQTKISDLHEKMNQMQISPEVFLYGWMFGLMSNCVPLQFMHLVLDKFRLYGWNFLYKLIVTYLLFLKNTLLLCNDSAEFLTQLNNSNSKQIGFHWQEILENCLKLEI